MTLVWCLRDTCHTETQFLSCFYPVCWAVVFVLTAPIGSWRGFYTCRRAVGDAVGWLRGGWPHICSCCYNIWASQYCLGFTEKLERVFSELGQRPWAVFVGLCGDVCALGVRDWAQDMVAPCVSLGYTKGKAFSTSLSPKQGSFSQGVWNCFLSLGATVHSTVCFWYTTQKNLYIPAFSRGNSLVQSQQQTVAEHTDTLKYLRVKCIYRLIQMRFWL